VTQKSSPYELIEKRIFFNLKMAVRTFKFANDIATSDMSLFLLALEMVSNRMCSVNENHVCKIFQAFSKKRFVVLFLGVMMFHQYRVWR